MTSARLSVHSTRMVRMGHLRPWIPQLHSACVLDGFSVVVQVRVMLIRLRTFCADVCISEDPSRAAGQRAEVGPWEGLTERTTEELTAHGIDVGQEMNAETMKGYAQRAAGLPYRTPVQLLNKLEFLRCVHAHYFTTETSALCADQGLVPFLPFQTSPSRCELRSRCSVLCLFALSFQDPFVTKHLPTSNLCLPRSTIEKVRSDVHDSLCW
ncbi:hypothetical protein C2E23DRAFT_798752 [Lenzites betulinus]|nr:hypothetical protein C2E23DRAFT_798752 [Lenzites betulinus]